MSAKVQSKAGTAASAKPASKAAQPHGLKNKVAAKVKKALCGSGATSVAQPEEVARLIGKGAFILDVRTMMEAKKGIAPGATSIPLLRLKRHLDELPRDRTIVTYCGTGERAGKARDILEAAGFKALNGGSYSGIATILAGTHVARG